MGVFDLFRAPDIDRGVAEWKNTPGAVLLDVRTREEYRGGRIPGSVNVPLDELSHCADRLPDRDAPLFVYCLSGARSGQAVRLLRQLGYTRAKSIGGISRYSGETEV